MHNGDRTECAVRAADTAVQHVEHTTTGQGRATTARSATRRLFAISVRGTRVYSHYSCRQYCERKVRRVRKSLKFVNAHKATGKHVAKFKSVRVLAKAVTDVK